MLANPCCLLSGFDQPRPHVFQTFAYFWLACDGIIKKSARDKREILAFRVHHEPLPVNRESLDIQHGNRAVTAFQSQRVQREDGQT